MTRDELFIDPPYAARLAACGLGSAEQILGRVDGTICAWSRSTETLYVGDDQGPGFFLKRHYYASARARLRGALRGTFFGRPRGEAEFKLLHELRKLGIPAVRPVAHGCRRRAHAVEATYLITEEVPESQNLTSLALAAQKGQRDVCEREQREMCEILATQVAALHDSGFVHGQLFWRNILHRAGPFGVPEFFLLDPRPRRMPRFLLGLTDPWVAELAQLATSARPFVARRERARFLVRYGRARELTRERLRQLIRDASQTDRRERHEQQRIRMSQLFADWNRRLRAEIRPAAGPPGELEIRAT